jgi:hypothetical protein
MRFVQTGTEHTPFYLYFVQPRAGKIGIRRINANGTLSALGEVGGLLPGVDPFAGTNPGISAFQERCFLQDPDSLSPECSRGSAQGIAGY